MEYTTKDVLDPTRAYGELAGKAVETMTLWAETNQRVMQEMVELGTDTAKESARLYADLQQTALDALRESQAAAQRWPASWEAGLKDPAGWSQRALLEGLEATEKAFRLFEASARAWNGSAERVQASAEQTGKSIREISKDVVARVKAVYAKS